MDDDKSVCRALDLLLNTYGLKVKTFGRAEDFFKAVPYDADGCLVLDLHLPGLDGWGVLRRLQPAGYRLPVVVISAEKAETAKEQVIKAGAVAFLQKPFNDQELVEIIKKFPSFNGGEKN